jgi:hypothetical protein
MTMKQNKWIVFGAVLIILSIVALMAYDFFGGFDAPPKNVYQFTVAEYEEVDSSLICYHEVSSFSIALKTPHALALDNMDRIFVGGEDSLLIFNENGHLQKVIYTGIETTALAVTDGGDILLGAVDHMENWTKDGIQKAVWETRNENVFITSIAVSDSSVFVADAGNKVVYHYNLHGDLLTEIGRKDSLRGIPGFVIPSAYFDVAMGRDGELWAVNSGLHQLEAYDFSGRLLSSWNKTSMTLNGFSGCCNPSHIALLSDGSFVTSEKGLIRIKIHHPNGSFKCVVAAPKQFDKGTTGLDLAVDSDQKIIVLDPKQRKIRVFKRNSL